MEKEKVYTQWVLRKAKQNTPHTVQALERHAERSHNEMIYGYPLIVAYRQWRFYIRGRWGTAPPDPDDAVVQKAQYIRTSRKYIYIYFFMQSSVNMCVNKLAGSI